MFAHERRQRILELLDARGQLAIGELIGALDASPATVRRDLGELQRSGALLRTHGGILHPAMLQGEPIFQKRAQVAAKAKLAIAREAAAAVGERQTVFIDTGTTALAVAQLLIARRDLILVTSSVPLLSLGRSDGARIVALGGDVRIPSQSLCGSIALAWLRKLRFDLAIIGASGLHPDDGASVTSLEEAEVKRASLERAHRSILVADSSKWRRPAAIVFSGWDAFDLWVTDAGLKSTELKTLARTSVNVRTVVA